MKKLLSILLLVVLLVPVAPAMLSAAAPPASPSAGVVQAAAEDLRAPAAPTQYPVLSIHDIQYTTDPGDGTYPSPYLDQVVKTSGVVVRVYPNYYSGAYFLMDPAGGAWNGIMVFDACRVPAVGETVELVATVDEYYGFTELTNVIGYTPTGALPVPDPLVVPTARLATANTPEDLESVLVAVHMATVTSGCNSYNEWLLQDSGGGAAAMVDDYGYVFCPAVGTVIEAMTATLWYTYDDFKLEPASAGDVRVFDNVLPSVAGTVPAPGATGVSPYAELHAVFSEPIDPATLDWTLSGPSGDVPGTVTYDEESASATFAPADFLAPLASYTAVIAGTLQDLRGNAMGADYTWSFTTGPADTAAPWVVSTSPAAGETGVSLYAAVIITLSEAMDPATINGQTVTLKKDAFFPVAGTVSYDPVSFRAIFTPDSLLEESSSYQAAIVGAKDRAGNVVQPYPAWSFTTGAAPEMHAYHGDLHNHTSYSDGSGTPAQAVATARAAGLEFFALTDHSYAISDAEWEDTLNQLNAANEDGAFITLRGFEYTQGGEGHINVYNTVRHATRALMAGCSYCDYTPNLEAGVTVQGFYPWLAITGTQALDDLGTLMHFNHPGWMNFNDWTYHPEVEEIAQLEEAGNGWGSSYVFSYDEWIRSLDYGWKVGATNNTDNHSMHWGTVGPNRTGVLMPELTRRALMEALQARRTFATEDSNFNLYVKGNGYWMGSDLSNTGTIAFEIWGDDPDVDDTVASVQLVTTQGQVVAEITPHSPSFDWDYALAGISAGAHYYFVLVTQADGDRIVSSPFWTAGTEDIRITDLTIQPSLPTIYNPNLFTARVSNRGATTQTITVTFAANGAPIGAVPLTVGACSVGPCVDGYASVSWQPATTGTVTITAALVGAPAADNPDDNARTLLVDVTAARIPLVVIDNGHGNIGADPRGTRMFVDDLTLHGYNVLFNLDEITPSDLNTMTVKLLVVNAYGPDPLTVTETQAVADFVAAGGSLWLNGMSDYTGKVWWAHNLAPRMNSLVNAVEARVGSQIPVRFNDDEVLDPDDNNGYDWGVLWHVFPVSAETGVGVNVNQIQSWSDCSLVDRGWGALTQADMGADGFLMVLGDDNTSNKDAEECYPTNDAYIYPAGIPVPMGAGYDIPGEAGRLFFYGDANDPFNVFAYVVGDGKQNELFNLEVVMWLLDDPLQQSTVAAARAGGDEPLNRNRLVWVEGFVTAGFGEFFDVLYTQDDTGGITIFAPAGTASGEENEAKRGDCVRVVGTVDIYQGDTEIQFFEATQVQVLTPSCVFSPALAVDGSVPLPMSTYQAGLEENEGWLVVVTGTVVQKEGSDAIWVDDGSGPLRLFLDGYNGDWSDVQVGHEIKIASLLSEDYAGQRVRMRNHGMHPALPDDVLFLEAPLPAIVEVWPPAGGTGVPLAAAVVVTFSRPIDTAAFTLTALPDPGGWAATWSDYDRVVHLAHAPLAYSTTYTLTVAAQDTLGRAVVSVPWSFTTAAGGAYYAIYLPVVLR